MEDIDKEIVDSIITELTTDVIDALYIKGKLDEITIKIHEDNRKSIIVQRSYGELLQMLTPGLKTVLDTDIYEDLKLFGRTLPTTLHKVVFTKYMGFHSITIRNILLNKGNISLSDAAKLMDYMSQFRYVCDQITGYSK